MKKGRKYILKTIIVFMICIFFTNFIWVLEESALTQYTSTNIYELDSSRYPGIKQTLQKIKEEHPNWNFKILYTGLDWNDVVQNEYTGHWGTPSNLVPANSSTYNNNWICDICGNQTYDTGEWLCASEEAISYMMDVRNWLNSENIFQFLELTYTGYNYEQIKSMVSGTFLDSNVYINTIIQSAQTYNVNVYYIIARIIQEQGKSGSELVAGKGQNGQYVGYYNVFNIGATGNTKEEVVLNGLKRAYKEGWGTLQASIEGGVRILTSSYIAQGQNTLYLQKFDVESSDGILYKHQYMQNILAAKNEALRLKTAINNLGAIDKEYTFIIPVYENMPAFTETEPNLRYQISDDLVKVNVTTTLRVRTTPGGIQTLTWVNGGDILNRVEKAITKVNGTYWDKIKIDSETYGYIARETYETSSEYKLYLVPVEDIIETPPEEDIPGDEAPDNSPGENIKYGDVNSDGKISPADYVLIKNHIMGSKLLETDDQKKAADVNRDGKISPTDYVRIKNYIMYGTEI